MLAPCEGKLTVNQNKPTQPSPLPLSLPLLLLFWLCLFVINKMIHLSAQTHPSRPLVTAFASLTQFSTEVNTSEADKRKCKNRHSMCYFYSLSALFYAGVSKPSKTRWIQIMFNRIWKTSSRDNEQLSQTPLWIWVNADENRFYTL